MQDKSGMFVLVCDADEKKEDLFNLLKRRSLDERSKLDFASCVPLNSNFLTPKPEKKESVISKTKLSVSSESSPDVEVPSENSDATTTNENLGIVKSILGPSFEDAVLRTLEFGKSLIQKSESPEADAKDKREEKKREGKRRGKASGKSSEGDKTEKNNNGRKEGNKRRNSKRRVAEKEVVPSRKVVQVAHVRPSNVAKIRSLDSELKQVAQSPEKIKRQLEALIQINKDELPERFNTWGYFYPKEYRPLKPHLEYTVMPTTVLRQTCLSLSKEEGCSCAPKCATVGNCYKGSKAGRSRADDSQDGNSSRRNNYSIDERSTRSTPNPVVRQAPEYISNALGPTLDVTIMDNLKLMRNLFRCEKSEQDGRGEPQPGTTGATDADGKTTLQIVDDLQRRVNELTERQLRLEREIEEEERERDAKRRAFQEEVQSARASAMDPGDEDRIRELNRSDARSQSRDCEQKFEALKCRIRSEEDRLSTLKEMSDSYESAINEARKKKDNLKRNKSLLDAWDVIASRVCHTRLPSFSKAQCLERKSLKPSKDVTHCCFPQAGDDSDTREDKSYDNSAQGRPAGRSRSLDGSRSKPCKPDFEDIPYPLQRDVVCGMHRLVKTCLCNEPLSKDTASWSSDEDIRKSSRIDQDMLHRSKSETVRRGQGTKLCRVLWAVTRINIFRDNSRTYEVMDATTIPPKSLPVRTEGVFVVKNPKKCCPEPQKRIS